MNTYKRYVTKANEQFSKRSYTKALRAYELALELDSSDAQIWNRIGLCYYKLKNYRMAIKCYEKSLSIIPNNTVTLNNLYLAFIGIKKAVDKIIKI